MTNRQVSICYMKAKTDPEQLILQTEITVLKLILQISGRADDVVFTM